MNKSSLINAIIILSIVFFGYKSEFNSEFDSMPIGSVIYSILPPTYFIDKHSEWVLLDGGQINNDWKLKVLLDNYTDYAEDTLPNTLGRFIRSANYNGIGIDLNQERKIGSIQEYNTAIPIEENGQKFSLFVPKHRHKYSDGMISENSTFLNDPRRGKMHPKMAVIEGSNKNHGLSEESDKDNSIMGRTKWTTDTQIGSSWTGSNNSIKIEGAHWNAETRPENVNFYTYIKVN